MKNYSGNRAPFLFVAAQNAESASAKPLLEALAEKFKLYVSSALAKKDTSALKKAAAVLLLFDNADAGAQEAAASLAAQEKKEIIPVFLEEAHSGGLPAGLKMLLGAKQGVTRSNYESDEAFAKALMASPVLQSLSVTPAQKKAARGTVLAALAALIVVAAGAFFAVKQFAGQEVSGKLFDKLGISGSVNSLKQIYAYGNELQESFEPYGAVDRETEGTDAQLYLAAQNKYLARGTVVHIDDFAQLTNLRELSLAGNAIRDITALYQLTKLEKLDLSANYGGLNLTGIRNLTNLVHLNLAFSEIDSGLEELKELPKLKTLTISGTYRDQIEALGAVNFTVYYPEMAVRSLEELQTATTTDYVRKIVIDRDEFEIPAGTTVTIREGVSLSAVGKTIHNNGTLVFFGNYETGMTTMDNHGTIRVEKGGKYISGMSETVNHGQFLVQEGGLVQLERGNVLNLSEGSTLENNGTLFLSMGGQLALQGGTVTGSGTFQTVWESAESMPDWAFIGDVAELVSASGKVVWGYQNSANTAPDYSKVLAKMTEEEKAVYNSILYPTYSGEIIPVTPYLETDDFLAKSPYSTACLMRDMILDYQPGWTGPQDFFEFIVAPGATVTITAGEWNAEIWITVMKGGTLVVESDFPVAMVVNFGTVTVNAGGKLRYLPAENPDELGAYRNFANAGLLQVRDGGSCELYRLWNFKGFSEEGAVNAAERNDRSTTEAPFAFAHEPGGLEAYVAN